MSGLGRDDFLLDDEPLGPMCRICHAPAEYCTCPGPCAVCKRLDCICPVDDMECGECGEPFEGCICYDENVDRTTCSGCGNNLPYCDCPVDPSDARDAEDWYRNHPSLTPYERG